MTRTDIRELAGRPKIDDREQVLGFVVAQVALGETQSAATKDGMAVAVQRMDAEGNHYLDVERIIPGATLRRRAQDHLKSAKAEFERMTAATRQPGARLIGISTSRPGFLHETPLKRGRPKKSRVR